MGDTAMEHNQFPIGLRKAVLTDASSIAKIHVQTWRRAYSGIVPSGYLDALSTEKRRKIWERILSDPKANTLVAEDGAGSIAGFASFGACRDVDGNDRGEVYGIYIDSQWWRKGCGMKLMRASEEELNSQGFPEATLWVLQQNTRARGFYESIGYEVDGSAKTVVMADAKLVEIRYRKDLEFH